MTELTLTRGDTLSVAWTVNTRTQNSRTGTYSYTPVTITGSSCRIYFREGSPTGTAVIQALSSGGSPQITITGAEGLIELEVDSTDTDALLGTYYYDVELTYSDGTVSTIDSGTLTVTADITYT